MAKKIKTLAFPDWLLRTDCEIYLDDGTVTEDGETKAEKAISTKCIFSEASRRIYEKDRKVTLLTGKIIVKGDIAPSLKDISGGFIIISKRKMQIRKGVRCRNPNGTVHHMEFDVE